MIRRSIVVAAGSLVTALSGCVDSTSTDDAAGASEQDLVSGCAGDFKLVGFTDAPKASTGIGRSGTIARAVLADADGDGVRDVVHISPGASKNPYVMGEAMTFDVTTVRNDGAGGLSTEFSQFEGHHAQALYTGDFDGDGRVDVAYLRYDANELWVVLRDPAGGWKPRLQVDVPLCGLSHLYVRPNSVVVRDFDNDGKVDILANIRTGERNAATVLLHGTTTGLGNGSCVAVVAPDDPRWKNGRVFDWLLAKAGRIDVGDFDGDGKLDATSTDGDDGAVLSDIFGEQRYAGWAAQRETVVVGRFNEDGKDDFLGLDRRFYTPFIGGSYEEYGSKLIVHRDNWGQFQMSVNDFGPRAVNLGMGDPYLTPGDFNADGRIDLVLHVNLPDEPVLVKNGMTPTPTMCSRPGAPHLQSSTRIPLKDGRRSLRFVGAANMDSTPGDELVAYYAAADGKPPAFAVYKLK